MDNSTLTTSTITLTDSSSNSVSGTVSSSDNTSANSTTVTFTPSSETGSYTATVSNSVKGLAGNSLTQNYSWSFESKWVGTKQLGTLSEDNATGVATDSSANVYVTGFTYGGLDGNSSAGREDLFVVKYNSSGAKQ